MLTKLYNYDTKNKLREWSVEYQEGKFRTIHGVVGGKLQTSNWYEVTETNVGRSNHRDLLQQAKFEAEALVKKQIEQGWKESIEALESSEKGFDCMLAQKYEDRKDELQFPVFVSPKLDGIRLNVFRDKLLSRNKKEFKSIPHLECLKEFCNTYNCILDGELYNHDLKHDFNKITSLVKKTKPTEKDLIESKKVIQYWVYDVYFLDSPDLPFKERFERVVSLLKKSPYVKIVPAITVNNSREIDNHYETFLEEGYEGQMVRTNHPYEQKRSKTLLKRKEFQDAEFKIFEVGEGNGNKSGMAGYMILKNRNGSTFRSNIKGSQEWLVSLLKDQHLLKGKLATVQFFNLTPDGVPRFPYVISIRDYE